MSLLSTPYPLSPTYHSVIMPYFCKSQGILIHLKWKLNFFGNLKQTGSSYPMTINGAIVVKWGTFECLKCIFATFVHTVWNWFFWQTVLESFFWREFGCIPHSFDGWVPRVRINLFPSEKINFFLVNFAFCQYQLRLTNDWPFEIRILFQLTHEVR